MRFFAPKNMTDLHYVMRKIGLSFSGWTVLGMFNLILGILTVWGVLLKLIEQSGLIKTFLNTGLRPESQDLMSVNSLYREAILANSFAYGVIATCIFIIFGLVLSILMFVVARPHRYAYFPEHAHAVVHAIRNGLVELDACSSPETFVGQRDKIVGEIVEKICESFTVITGYPNRACISGINIQKNRDGRIDDDNTTVYVIARDKRSAISNLNIDKKDNTKHNIRCNTSYSSIIYGNSTLYFSNNIRKDYRNNKYITTSFAKYRHEDANNTTMKDWPLPYLAVLISPIWYSPSKNAANAKFYGFLCIDSPISNTYDTLYQKEMMGIFSDALAIFYDKICDKEKSFNLHGEGI